MIERIGKYEIQAELGRGGFGRVYRAHDPGVNRLVAIKVLTSEGDPDLLGRFRAEAGTTGNLIHKNIVTVYDYGEHNGMPYLVMELLEGQNFYQIIHTGKPFSLLEKVGMMSQVAEGLHAAHLRGVVHRDVKPSNIMLLPDGNVKIMDFGIARVMGQSTTRRTRKGDLLGTILYMAPEQFRGLDADARSDIFSYAIVYYELLTGIHPFPGKDAGTVMYSITSTDPEPLSVVVRDLPERLEAIVNRALAKDTELRYQTFEDLLFDTAPILLELRQARAQALTADIAPLIHTGELDSAQAKIKQVLELDAGNTEARRWRDLVQQELHRKIVQSRVESLVLEAEARLAERSFHEAIQAIESAIRLDKTNPLLLSRLEAVKAAQEAVRRAARLVSQARRQLQLGNLAAAYESVSAAVEADPQSADAATLRDELRAQIDRQEREARLKNALLLAEEQRAKGDHEAALAALSSIDAEQPGSPLVAELRAQVETERAQAARRLRAQQFKAGIAQARFAVRDQRLADAELRLESLCAEFPEEPGAAELLSEVRGLLAAQRRAEAIGKLNQRARALIEEEKFLEARRTIEAGLHEFSSDAGLRRLLQTAVDLEAARERAEAIRRLFQAAQELSLAGKLDEALQLVQGALTQYGDESSLVELKRQLEFERDQQRYAAGLRRALDDGRRLLNQGRPKEAVSSLEQAVGIYPSESELASLLALARQARAELQEREFVTKVLSEATNLEQGRQWLRALHKVEQALGRYPHNAGLAAKSAKLRDTLQQEERRQRLEQVAAEIQKSIDAGDWAQAGAALKTALEEFPGDESLEKLSELMRQQQLAAQKRAEALGKLSQQANALIKNKNLKEARRALEVGLVEYPSDTGLQHLLETAKALQAAHDREQAIAKVVEDVKALRSAGKWDEALRVVASARDQFGKDVTLVELNRQLEFDWERQRYQAGLRQALEEGRSLLSRGRAGEAVSFLEQAVASYPHESQLAIMLASARQAQSEQEEQRFVQQVLAEARELEQRREWRTALLKIEQALGPYPDSSELTKAAESLRDSLQREEVRQKIERHVQVIQNAIAAQDWAQASTAANAALKQFPGEKSIQDLAETVRRRLQQAELEKLAAQVRQQIAQNDLEDAERQLDVTRTMLAQTELWQVLQRELAGRRAYQNRLDEAQECRKQGRFPDAEDILRRLIGQQPPDGRAENLLREISEERQRKERDEAIRKGREEADLILRQGNVAGAVAQLDRLIGQFPESSALRKDRQAAQALVDAEGERKEAERQRIEAERLEQERKELERKEAARLEAERQEAERKRVEAERREQERKEIERKQAARLEAERQEAERKRVEAERREQERKEIERKEAARLEAERQEAERKRTEAGRRQKEIERKEAARLEAERREAERKRIESERREQERKEIERKEAARLEAERQEAERKRLEAKRLEKERKEKERKEAVRREAERREAERTRELHSATAILLPGTESAPAGAANDASVPAAEPAIVPRPLYRSPAVLGAVTVVVLLAGSAAYYLRSRTTESCQPNPAELSFTYQTGAKNPEAKPVSCGPINAHFEAKATDAWLMVSPSRGDKLDRVEISVDPAKVRSSNAKQYHGAIQLVIGSPRARPLTVPVSLTVTEPARLEVSSESLWFDYTNPRELHQTKSFRVVKGDNFTVTPDKGSQAWLAARKLDDQGTVAVVVSPRNLMFGHTYQGSIMVQSPGLKAAEVKVTLKVIRPKDGIQ